MTQTPLAIWGKSSQDSLTMKNLTFLPLLTNTVSGYSVAYSPETEHSRTMAEIYAKDSRAVARFDVVNPKGVNVSVELYYRLDRAPIPHGYSLDGRDDYSGSLSFANHELTDFDGLTCLPKSVCAVLRALGFTVSDDCLSSPLS